MNGWAHLNQQQQDAVAAAARLTEDAGLRFVFLMFTEDGVGAVISNIEPGDAVPMISEALKAAKANVGIEPIDIIERERLQ
jgi:hypothetical protein